MKQKQFLNLATAEEAENFFWRIIPQKPLGKEIVLLKEANGRILANDIFARNNVPFFDRSNFDGFALRAEDTFGTHETAPITINLKNEVITCGVIPKKSVEPGEATPIATGGVLPRGANGVVMIENTLSIKSANSTNNQIQILKPIVPGNGISLAGSDIGAGELVLRMGERLGYRETGTLAALGESEVSVWKKPKVGIISTGDELIPPGESVSLGKVYDSNSTLIAHALDEICCEPFSYGIISDDESQLEAAIRKAIPLDFVIISGGTSKGEGDLNYQILKKFNLHKELIHGVSLKPGKPLCLAFIEGTPIAILPGFPTSATFTFSKFVSPILRVLAGMPPENSRYVKANIPLKINSEKGKTEFNMVHLIRKSNGFSAYSTGKGSGSITGFVKADGFFEIPRNIEILEAGDEVSVKLLGDSVNPPDLMIIGSHCVGLDYLIGEMRKLGLSCQFLSVGSMGGILAVKREECDIACAHLIDPISKTYNKHLLTQKLHLEKGYKRNQGLIFRKDDPNFYEFSGKTINILKKIANNMDLRMINRNRGSGTRILLDDLLKNSRPSGFFNEAKSHNSVAAAISQKRADWGIAIRSVAEDLSLGFYPIQDEEYDFIIPKNRLDRYEVKTFLKLLKEPEIITHLHNLGLELNPKTKNNFNNYLNNKN